MTLSQRGDGVFFCGLFESHLGQKKNQPIFRFGKVALMSDEKIEWQEAKGLPAKLLDLYLMEFGQRDMPTIVHFQILSDDVERSKKFYNVLFAWKFDKFPSPPGSEAMPEGMEYWLISTVDDKGDEARGEGMMKRQSPQQQGITNYFDVKSVQEYSSKIEQLGGKVISPKMPVLGMGYFAVCKDTENNGFGIFEADQTAK